MYYYYFGRYTYVLYQSFYLVLKSIKSRLEQFKKRMKKTRFERLKRSFFINSTTINTHFTSQLKIRRPSHLFIQSNET